MMPLIQKLYFQIVDSPYFNFESVMAVLIPLVLVALMFNWRVKQSMKKQKKLQKRRENLLRKLNEGRSDRGNEGENENDEVLNEAIRLMEEKSKKMN